MLAALDDDASLPMSSPRWVKKLNRWCGFSKKVQILLLVLAVASIGRESQCPPSLRGRPVQAGRTLTGTVPPARQISRMMTIDREHLSKADAVTAAAIETGVPALAYQSPGPLAC